MPYLIKVVLSALMIVAITEATKRMGFWGALKAFGWRFWNQQENWLKEKDKQKGMEKL